MLSSKQCEIARTMTQDNISDLQIIQEYEMFNDLLKPSAVNEIDNLLKQHDAPFDKAFKTMVKDFSIIANKYSISPSTLFCIYMDNKSK